MRYDIRRVLGSGDRYAEASSPLRRRLRLISKSERKEEARAFLNQMARETGMSKSARQKRWATIKKDLAKTGIYRHDPEELAFGARVAWRNHGRCIGRLFWQSLEVSDCRHLTEPDQMASRMVNHMRDALGDGRITSTISVFAPVEGDVLPSYVESSQITQYAGYLLEGADVLGDRQNVEATRIARSMGWEPEGDPTAFDLLPFAIRDQDDQRYIYRLPDDAVRHVAITHPTEPAISEMGLQWYAVPCVSNMILSIGGIDYPCAPFNGFYMGTEIASRNFADHKRYDLLPAVAERLGLSQSDPLWLDTTLTELNRAVLHSYKAARVTLVDHHTAAKQYMDFHQREQANGRRVPGDWRWIVPPQASGIMDVFHLKMRNYHPVPNYYSSRSDDGWRLMPYYGDSYQSRLRRDYDRIARRLRLWKRMSW